MKFKEIAFTGMPVKEIKRSRAFYEGVLGLKPALVTAEGMWVEYDIGPGTLALGCFGEMWKTSEDGQCVALELEDFDEAVAALKAQGIKFAVDVMDSPVCQFAIICDPDDNRVMLHKRKAK